ncbi:hypothetical protein LTR10_018062 [Elasticomyces elasticus]|uniref:Class II aldolase/adducin N-terminal domain-containing protein n=1 Tax=Exophiala sideris TaxID=1016849 RepID=A0ABR0JPL5_9EURO|nr:hypothetical protein LTR10_018062 [Elasticomyces elasticus]KAK5039534.1 hypothetical protein LTS07_000028 [Exophiala sideris]KAK5041087.1 hypothetical protein LTR13_002561 [Exophiala sideris]KAK5067911.1 hypothetical protein LTR69_000028 [Exophiala sideris]KAK5187213.1 hypothetical protein LTR44_000028 [Eurotiomycetes sp. CCFEE 6388]
MSATTTVTVSRESNAPAATHQSALNTTITSSGRRRVHHIPKPPTKEAERRWQLEHMAGAFRVFAKLGYASGASGHISLRDPVEPNSFWINPYAIHFGMLKVSDMVRVDEEGNWVGGSDQPVNTAGFIIHSHIHKARPDLNAACHMHSPYGRAWSTFGKPIEMLNQDSCMFYNDLAVYAGPGGIVLGKKEGAHIAAALGPTKKNIILQNHGILTAGRTVDEAAAYFIALERACQNQIIVTNMLLTNDVTKNYVSDEEAAYIKKQSGSPEVMYMQFKPEYELALLEHGGEFLG